MQQELTLADFADLLGTTVEGIPAPCQELIAKHDFRFRPIEGRESDDLLREVLQRIESGELTVAGREGKGRWEKGWSENLESFLEKGGDVSALVPKYIRSDQPLRLRQRYIMPAYGGFYAPLDEAAAEAFAAELEGVEVVPILCGESQRRVGAVHCSVSAYPQR